MRTVFVLLALSLAVQMPAQGACIEFHRPVPGQIISPFSPIGRFSGHWGADLASEVGDPVQAAAAGTVTFSGVVAGNETVTVAHGGGLKTSYSYLSERTAVKGQWLQQGAQVGSTGLAHGESQLHFSVRIGNQYRDPAPFLSCLRAAPAQALRLVA